MHFAIGVMTKLGPNDEGYEEELKDRLSPFSEHLRVEPYISCTYEDIITRAKEIKQQAETEGLTSEWHKKFVNCKTDQDFWNAWTDNGTESEAGYDEHGNELTTYNPKSEWDWYEIGGRWAGFFDENPKAVNSNCIKIEDWDFGSTTEKREKDKRWYEILCMDSPKKEEENQEWYDSIKGWNNPDYYRRLYPTLEDYLNAPSQLPYSILDLNGDWWQRDFGDHNSQEYVDNYIKWEKEIPEKIKKFTGNYCTIVDCHI